MREVNKTKTDTSTSRTYTVEDRMLSRVLLGKPSVKDGWKAGLFTKLAKTAVYVEMKSCRTEHL